MHVSHTSLSNPIFSDNALSEIMTQFISRTISRFHLMPVKKSVFWSRLPTYVQVVLISQAGGGI